MIMKTIWRSKRISLEKRMVRWMWAALLNDRPSGTCISMLKWLYFLFVDLSRVIRKYTLHSELYFHFLHYCCFYFQEKYPPKHLQINQKTKKIHPRQRKKIHLILLRNWTRWVFLFVGEGNTHWIWNYKTFLIFIWGALNVLKNLGLRKLKHLKWIISNKQMIEQLKGVSSLIARDLTNLSL